MGPSNPIKKLPAAKIIFAYLLIAGIIAGCSPVSEPPLIVTPSPNVVYQMDPAIREVYEHYGGAGLFGEPISQMVEQAGNKYQFSAAALWVVDAQASPDEFVRLAPLGASIIPPDRQDPPQPPPEQEDPYYVNGQYVYEPFRGLYDKLMGQKMVGRPLTGVRYDALTDRYEQFFENLGFYIHAGENEQPGLLNYGAWLCNNQCRSPQQLNGAIQHSPTISAPFDVAVERLGREFTGEPLAMAAYGADGQMEQVFANLVLMADAYDPTNPNLVTARPIVELLGNLPAPLASDSPQPDLYFFEVNSGLGYNIPNVFKELIDQHGGFNLSGDPINEMALINERIYRQCFRNLCLDYDPSAPEHLRIRPTALGVEYLKSNLRSPVQPTVETQSFRQFTIQVWETQAQVASNQEQEIWVSLSENGQPLSSIQSVLFVYLPDGNQVRFDLEPSGGDGRTSIRIPPIAAANGVLIPYELCIPQGEQMFCVRQEYLILNVP